MKYKSYRFVDGKARWVIVDETGKIIDKNPNKGEWKGLNVENRHYRNKKCTDNELLRSLELFYQVTGRLPLETDFMYNHLYPSYTVYQRRFGSWSNGLKLVGLDVDTLVKKGILNTVQQKARLAELVILEHFDKNSVDLSGKDQNCPCDGICPNGKIYDVKSSKFYKYNWHFRIENSRRYEIELYYLVGMNKDWTKVEHIWRIPGEMVEKQDFNVGIAYAEFNIDNLEQYDIIGNDKLRDILKKYDLLVE